MFSVLTFDFDGTIVDSMNHLAEIAAKQMNNYYGISEDMGRHLYLFTSGIPFSQQMELIFPGKEENKNIVENFEKIKAESVMQEPLFPEAKNILSELSEKGYKLVISSSNFQNLVEKYVNKHNLDVDLVLGYRENFEKGRDHFQYIKKHFGVDKDDICFIGDSLKDFQRANNNKICFIGRSGTFTEKRLQEAGVRTVISEMTELESILKEL